MAEESLGVLLDDLLFEGCGLRLLFCRFLLRWVELDFWSSDWGWWRIERSELSGESLDNELDVPTYPHLCLLGLAVEVVDVVVSLVGGPVRLVVLGKGFDDIGALGHGFLVLCSLLALYLLVEILHRRGEGVDDILGFPLALWSDGKDLVNVLHRGLWR